MSKWEKLLKIIDNRDELTIRDLIILALWSLGGKAPRKDYVHKLLYIISKKQENLSTILGFEEYKRGPWSEIVADTMDMLVDDGILDYEDKGVVLLDKEIVTPVLHKADKKLIELFKREGEILSKLDYEEMLLYIYVLYRGYSFSEVKDQIFAKRRELALSMLRKGVVSASIAAKLAGMSYREFLKYARQKGVRPFIAGEDDIEKIKETLSSSGI